MEIHTETLVKSKLNYERIGKIVALSEGNDDFSFIVQQLRDYKFYYRFQCEFADILQRLGSKTKVFSTPNTTKTIWWCWLQGFDNAPPLTHHCFASVKKFFHGFETIVLDETNLPEYVSIPDFIKAKYLAGTISKAHFSDIVRTLLLLEHGGIWIDSTVFCSGDKMLGAGVFDEPFFCFRFTHPSALFRTMENWLLSAAKGHPYMLAMKALLFSYWKNYDITFAYFIYNILFRLVTDYNPQPFGKMSKYPAVPSFMLASEMTAPYYANRWKQISGMTDFHKLSFKQEDFGGNDGMDTFHNALMDGRLLNI